jgi:hypothetical protein
MGGTSANLKFSATCGLHASIPLAPLAPADGLLWPRFLACVRHAFVAVPPSVVAAPFSRFVNMITSGNCYEQ